MQAVWETESPGPQLSAPSLTLNVSGSQVTAGLFIALVSTFASNLTTEDPTGQRKGTSVDNLSQSSGVEFQVEI